MDAKVFKPHAIRNLSKDDNKLCGICKCQGIEALASFQVADIGKANIINVCNEHGLQMLAANLNEQNEPTQNQNN